MRIKKTKIKIELVTKESLQKCIDFLEDRKETCLFLLGNLFSHGFQPTDHINSGHYWLLKNGGTVVGVFSVNNSLCLIEKRRKGYSKVCMRQLISDSTQVHQLNSLILFTGEHNTAAQSLYESLGFREIGYFGLIFNSP